MSVCVSLWSRAVVDQLVSNRLLCLQPHPHPFLQGVLRPPLPGCLRLSVTVLRKKQHNLTTKDWVIILAQRKWRWRETGKPPLWSVQCRILNKRCKYIIFWGMTIDCSCVAAKRNHKVKLHRCLLLILERLNATWPHGDPVLDVSLFMCKATFGNGLICLVVYRCNNCSQSHPCAKAPCPWTSLK